MTTHAPVPVSQPLIVIEAGGGPLSLRLGEIWAFRELLYLLIWRDVRVRYRQTALGVAWAVLQPLAATAVFTVFFGRLAGVPPEGVPYPLFARAGVVPLVFLSGPRA